MERVSVPIGNGAAGTCACNTAARNSDAVPRRHARKIHAAVCEVPKSGAPSAPGNAAT